MKQITFESNKSNEPGTKRNSHNAGTCASIQKTD